MKLKKVNIDEIKEYKNNPRFNDDGVEYVKKSIEDFGYLNPILVNKKNIILSGHTRYKALKKMNKKIIEVIEIDDLNKEQENAFRLADNKVAEFSSWDYDKLNVELKEIKEDLKKYDFEDIELTDLSNLDFDDFIGDEEVKKKEVFCPYCGEKIK